MNRTVNRNRAETTHHSRRGAWSRVFLIPGRDFVIPGRGRAVGRMRLGLRHCYYNASRSGWPARGAGQWATRVRTGCSSVACAISRPRTLQTTAVCSWASARATVNKRQTARPQPPQPVGGLSCLERRARGCVCSRTDWAMYVCPIFPRVLSLRVSLFSASLFSVSLFTLSVSCLSSLSSAIGEELILAGHLLVPPSVPAVCVCPNDTACFMP